VKLPASETRNGKGEPLLLTLKGEAFYLARPAA
jgi:hypothetical protein